MLCKYFLVSGDVQGVFYRRHAQQMARSIGLTGWVRNTQDNKVEVLACGDEAQISVLEKWLWQGPPKATVQKVIAQEAAVDEVLTDFEVR